MLAIFTMLESNTFRLYIQMLFFIKVGTDMYKFLNKQARRFSASKCDVGNWIFSKSYKWFEKLFGFFWGTFWEFFGNFLGGFFLEGFFERIFLRGFFGEDVFGRIFWEYFFGRNSLRGIT